MLKAEMAPCFVMAMLLIPTPTIADVTSELARCQLEAEHLYPAPSNKGAQNWPERAANLQKRSENIETCVCEGLVIVSPQNVLFPSRPMKAA